MPPLRYFASFFCLHHLRHEAAHRLCGFVLLLPRSVGVGAECESSVIVAEHRCRTSSAATCHVATVYSSARLTSTPFAASIAAASFALHSACVLPRTFLMMRFIVSTSAPHLSCCRGRKCMVSYSRGAFPKVKDTTLKPTLTFLPNKTIWEANPMKKLIPANIPSITAVWN